MDKHKNKHSGESKQHTIITTHEKTKKHTAIEEIRNAQQNNNNNENQHVLKTYQKCLIGNQSYFNKLAHSALSFFYFSFPEQRKTKEKMDDERNTQSQYEKQFYGQTPTKEKDPNT